MPKVGWSEDDIDTLLRQFGRMDSNSFTLSVGAGEREGRVSCGLVRRRHFGMAHGVGRSGDIAAVQPKAAGSSLVNKLVHRLALDAVRAAGISRARSCLVLPTATGMSLTLCMLALRSKRPKACYVIWSRIDQKACFKSICTSGCTPVIVQLLQGGSPGGAETSSIMKTSLSSVEAETVSKLSKFEAAGTVPPICTNETTSRAQPIEHSAAPALPSGHPSAPPASGD